MNIDIEYLGEKCGKNICVQNFMNNNGKDVLDEWYNERVDYINVLRNRTEFFEAKLKLAKREYKIGKYIEEILE